uniref:Uncharacterized protein n=1 Tax=Pyxicephalus adspersus TaxID=30357 RepID=A0AAV3APA2_PYXAD|nr:TPA: hypothetical protein GDO54_008742 [Pyxicephalus adspersus]
MYKPLRMLYKTCNKKIKQWYWRAFCKQEVAVLYGKSISDRKGQHDGSQNLGCINNLNDGRQQQIYQKQMAPMVYHTDNVKQLQNHST